MKNTKNLLINVITVAISLIILVGCIIAVSADTPTITYGSDVMQVYNEQKHGSVDKGIKMAKSYLYKFYPSVQYGNPNINGHPNFDFEMGWQYWIDNGGYEIKKDSTGNYIATTVTTDEYKGMYSVKFTDTRIKEGDSIAVLYKWRNKAHQLASEPKLIQLYNNYYDESRDPENSTNPQHQLVHGSADGRSEHTIWRAADDDDMEWNISLSRVYHNVRSTIGENPISYYYLGFQSRKNSDIFTGTDFDDLQLVHYNQSSGIITSLDGKQLYNLNSLPTREDPHYVFGDLGLTDPNADIVVDVNDLISGKIDPNQSIEDSKQEIEDNKQNQTSSDVNTPSDPSTPSNSSSADEGIATWIWIVIAVAVVLILAAAAIYILLIRKKKAIVTTEE